MELEKTPKEKFNKSKLEQLDRIDLKREDNIKYETINLPVCQLCNKFERFGHQI